MFTYVCTHGHRTRHDPLRRAAGRPGTHDIAHEHNKQEAKRAALHPLEERQVVGSRLEGPRWQADRDQLPPWSAAAESGGRQEEAGRAAGMAAAETAAEVMARAEAEEKAEAREAEVNGCSGSGGGGSGGEAVGGGDGGGCRLDGGAATGERRRRRRRRKGRLW